MTTKHTNGPWYAFEPQHDTGEIIITRDCSYDTKRLCKVLPVSPNNADTIANARLIAAAPELLEALESCLTMDGATAERSHEMALTRLRAINELATAAIKAAKGE